MKIRNGFVSNSSSSSFIVAGVNFKDVEDLKESMQTLDPNGFEQIREEFDSRTCEWSKMSTLAKLVPDGMRVQQVTEDMDNLWLGYWKDPESLTMDDALNGWLTVEQKQALDDLADKIGAVVSVDGGECYT